MSKGLPILALLLAGSVVGIAQVSKKGVGVPEPAKDPVSIREKSVHRTTHGRHRTYYFMGGGPRYGK